MFQNLTGWHALIILAIVVLIFGAAKLPALARSVGQSMRILKNEVQTPESDRSAEAPREDVKPVTTAVPVASTADETAARRPVLSVAE